MPMPALAPVLRSGFGDDVAVGVGVDVDVEVAVVVVGEDVAEVVLRLVPSVVVADVEAIVVVAEAALDVDAALSDVRLIDLLITSHVLVIQSPLPS